MKQEVKQGQTDYTTLVLVRDTSGNAKTALAFGDIDLAYARVETDNDVTTTDVAPADLVTPALTDPHLDWGFLEVSAADHPGIYRLDYADAVFAAGAWSAVVTLTGAGLEPSHMEFMLIPAAPIDGVQLQSTHAGVTFATLSVTGQLDAGNVLVDGTTVLTGNTTLTGAVSLGSTLGITGATTLASLSVTGQLDAGNVVVDAGMDVVGALSVNSLLIDTTTTFTGNVEMSGNLAIVGTQTNTGAVTFTAGLASAITGNITGDLSGSVGSLTGHTNQTADNNTILAHADYGNDQLVRSTTPANKLDVSNTGEAGLDFDNIKDATGAHTLTNVTVPTVTTVGTCTTNTDLNSAQSEPAQGAFAANATPLVKIANIHKVMRNKKTNDGTTRKLFNDAGAVVDQKSGVAEAAGTVTVDEWESGP